MASNDRIGRSGSVEPGQSQNVYLPSNHIDYVDALAAANHLSFSAAVRLIIESDWREHLGRVRVFS